MKCGVAVRVGCGLGSACCCIACPDPLCHPSSSSVPPAAHPQPVPLRTAASPCPVPALPLPFRCAQHGCSCTTAARAPSCLAAPPLTQPPCPSLQLYNGSQNPYFLAARRLYDQFWAALRSSVLPSLEAAGIVEPKL